MKSLDRHQRAYADASDWDGATLKSAVALAQGYPIELRTMGTLQTIAFSMGKNDKGHVAIARAIAGWVLSDKSGAPLGTVARPPPEELLKRLATANREAYLAADAEAIAFADALKTVSKALYKALKAPAPQTPAPPERPAAKEEPAQRHDRKGKR